MGMLLSFAVSLFSVSEVLTRCIMSWGGGSRSHAPFFSLELIVHSTDLEILGFCKKLEMQPGRASALLLSTHLEEPRKISATSSHGFSSR